MGIPGTERDHSDVIDFITDSARERIQVRQEDDTLKTEEVLNFERIWWKTHNVNSTSFGRFAFLLKEYESLAEEAFSRMSKPRAKILAQQILARVSSYRYSIDAKSSESVLDKNNRQQTLVQMLNKNSIERKYVVKEEMKKGFASGFIGRDQAKDQASD
ncbi:MAG: hypothetical protein KGJ07_07530 [Patescibacteria group bacterium]|nr:hypothetical protein [Patescibacteria group bacterium]